MNWVDLVIFIFIGLFALSGFYKGALRQVFNIVIFLASIVFTVIFYDNLGSFLASQFAIAESISKLIAFVILAVCSQFILNIALMFLYPLIPQGIRKSSINKVLGVFPGFLWGVVFISILVAVVSALPVRFPYKEDIAKSFSGRLISERLPYLEDYVAKIVGEVSERAVTFRTVSPSSGETSDLGFTVTEDSLKVDEWSEKKMLDLVNEERVKAGLKPLKMDLELTRLARVHSRDMFLRGYFSHVNPDGKDPFHRMDDFGIEYFVAGENLALAPNVDLAHEGLMNSPGHRANILTAEFGLVGIGSIDGGRYGKMFTQKFTD